MLKKTISRARLVSSVCLIFSGFFSQTLTAASVSYNQNGMVVSAQHLATQVGIHILKKGGNAIDAAVAMGYALAVVEPCCGNIGGGGFMMIALADGTKTTLSFREKAPAALDTKLLANPDNAYAAVGVPGSVKGLNAALNRYGSMPLKQIIQPAIKLAEKGFILKQQDVQFLNMGTEAFQQQPNVASIFLKAGRPYQVGERLVQKQLGHTLRLIAEQGDYAFYQGSIAQALVNASRQHQGVLNLSDLKNYTVRFEKPRTCHYRNYQVLTTPSPSVGGKVLCELLTHIQRFPLNHYGYGSLKTLSTNLDAIQQIYQQHALYQRESLNTTSYLVADAQGNLVAVTYSLNGAFGARVIAGTTGFFLNNELKDFAYSAPSTLQKIGNTTPISFITQALILKQNKPFLMLASPGGDTIPTQLLITLENFIDFKMSLTSAINAPRYHFRWEKKTAHLEPEWNQSKKQLLETAGYRIGKGSGTDLSLPYWGAMTGIYITPHSIEGVIDKRRPAGMAQGL